MAQPVLSQNTIGAIANEAWRFSWVLDQEIDHPGTGAGEVSDSRGDRESVYRKIVKEYQPEKISVKDFLYLFKSELIASGDSALLTAFDAALGILAEAARYAFLNLPARIKDQATPFYLTDAAFGELSAAVKTAQKFGGAATGITRHYELEQILKNEAKSAVAIPDIVEIIDRTAGVSTKIATFLDDIAVAGGETASGSSHLSFPIPQRTINWSRTDWVTIPGSRNWEDCPSEEQTSHYSGVARKDSGQARRDYLDVIGKLQKAFSASAEDLTALATSVRTDIAANQAYGESVAARRVGVAAAAPELVPAG